MTGISLHTKSYSDGFESQRRVLDVQAADIKLRLNLKSFQITSRNTSIQFLVRTRSIHARSHPNFRRSIRPQSINFNPPFQAAELSSEERDASARSSRGTSRSSQARGAGTSVAYSPCA